MFESLTEKLGGVFKKVTGRGKLSESNVQAALKEVRLALLEADVNYKVVKELVEHIRERALGHEVLQSLSPGQQLIKIVNEELTRLMGEAHAGLRLVGRPPYSLMLIGLQGSGKTTTAAKLARYLRKQGRQPYLVPADIYRPAAIEQLRKLGEQIGVPVHPTDPNRKPEDICADALSSAGGAGADVLIIDTAGRLHIDEALMAELVRIKEKVHPTESLLVADAMTGQDAVNVAKRFNESLDLTGVILSKMEGDARGGAALSIKAVTDTPIKFIGVGEKLDALELFYPDRMASQILGMGDMLSLIEKAQSAVDENRARELEKKLRKNQFTLQDFRDQMAQVRKMGPMEDLLAMIPGMGKLKQMKQFSMDERELVSITAIIDSMTAEERCKHYMINASRRKRIAKGSGTTVQEVNQLLKNYVQVQKMIKKLNKGGLRALGRGGLPF